MKCSLAATHAHGELHRVKFGSKTAGVKAGLKIFQYVFECLVGIQIRRKKLESNVSIEEDAEEDEKRIDEGFAFIEAK